MGITYLHKHFNTADMPGGVATVLRTQAAVNLRLETARDRILWGDSWEPESALLLNAYSKVLKRQRGPRWPRHGCGRPGLSAFFDMDFALRSARSGCRRYWHDRSVGFR